MNALQDARFQAPTAAEQAIDESARRAQQQRHEAAKHCAYTAMRAGVPELIVDRTHSTDTLASMLSAHTLNYRFSETGTNPAMLLAKMLAVALHRECPDAEAFAQSIARDYAVSREDLS
jgi:hypothetical protein